MIMGHHRFIFGAIAVIAAVSGLHAISGGASAASMAVEIACASDYFAYCSQHDPDSDAARRCMDAHGNNLSKRCVNALIRAGEISKADVDRRASRTR